MLKELQVLLTSSQRAAKTYALGEDVLQEVAKKLEEVRDLLAVDGGDLSATISFCLEEVVRESQPALARTKRRVGVRGEGYGLWPIERQTAGGRRGG